MLESSAGFLQFSETMKIIYRVKFRDQSVGEWEALRYYGRDSSHVFVQERDNELLEVAIPTHKVWSVVAIRRVS